MCLEIIYLIFMYKKELALTYNSWYNIKPNQTEPKQRKPTA